MSEVADLHCAPQGVVELAMPVGVTGETSTMRGLVCWHVNSKGMLS